MRYFDQEYLEFFKTLAANNNKEWFHANKKMYESAVKKPFTQFVASVIENVQKEDVSVQLETKDALGRINRDIRFSKEKSPYNLYMTAYISPKGKKDKSYPGVYFRFGPGETGFMAGSYNLDKNQLQKVREAITNNLEEFQSIYMDSNFKSHLGTIQGEVNKRIPSEFKAIAERESLIANKQFYAMSLQKPEAILEENLMDNLLAFRAAATPLNQFLIKALND